MVRETLSRRTFVSAGVVAPLSLACVSNQQRSPAGRIVHRKGEKVSFFADGRLLFEYRYAAYRPKTYVHPFCAPDGSPLTIDGPPDHVHHRGLMLAWSDVNGFDFWGETNPAPHGRIVHQRLEQAQERSAVEITSIEHWIADGVLLLVERRTIRVPEVSSEAVWLEWLSELKAVSEPVLLSAEKHVYNGLGIRFVHSMDGGGVLNATGTSAVEKANGEGAIWCTYYGPTEKGGFAGVAIFDHPENPRHPTPFFVMNKPFGYLSAAPTFREPLRLIPGQSLRLCYAVVSYLGEPNAARLNEMYQRWSKREI